MISNCGITTDKVSKILDHDLKPVMQKGESYIKDTGDSLNKIKNINTVPENAVLVTADLVFIQAYHIKLVCRHLKRHWINGKQLKYLRVN